MTFTSRLPEKFRRLKLRKWLRSLHRDAGYLAVGLTFVYAMSGLAINHISDWDPNFEQIEEHFTLPDAAPKSAPPTEEPLLAQRSAEVVLRALGRTDKIEDAYVVGEQHLDITLPHSTLYVDFERRSVREAGQRPRMVLRAANWLHLNRGKKAWTYIADGYAVFLLFLATSGLFMLPGKKGLVGRGAALALLGAAVPVIYVVMSDGP